MNPQFINQLDKVLALADSSHDGEAVVAVRKARQMLSRDGLSFGDLARAAVKKPTTINLPFSFTSGTPAHVEIEMAQMRQRIAELEAGFDIQNMQTELWRQKALELEQKLSASQVEAARWRQLARDTVEKMWDLGQAVQQDEFESDTPYTETTAKTA